MVNGTGVIAAENHRLTARNLPVAPQPRALFVNHSSVISGAELILLDTVIPWAGASAFLFEAGPLQPALADRGLHTIMARWGAGLSGVRRDSNLLAALPLAGRLLGVAAELASVARGFDVLYANSQKAFVLAAFAARWARVPLIWHLHDIIDDAHFGAAQRRLQIGLANNWTWRVIVPSQAAASAFVAAGGHADRVQIVVNGLDISPDPPSPSRAALGLPEGKLFGVFSRLAPWKGQHVALDALAQIPDASCVIVGSALFHEDAYEARLRAQAAQPGLAGRVHFLGQRSDVGALMQAVDVMVHPSVDPEPFGRTLVEAMRVGTPVIASDSGAAAEILDGGNSGTLVPPGDAAALAAALRRVLDRPDHGQCARAEARARAVYGVAAMQAALGDVIRQSVIFQSARPA